MRAVTLPNSILFKCFPSYPQVLLSLLVVSNLQVTSLASHSYICMALLFLSVLFLLSIFNIFLVCVFTVRHFIRTQFNLFLYTFSGCLFTIESLILHFYTYCLARYRTNRGLNELNRYQNVRHKDDTGWI